MLNNLLSLFRYENGEYGGGDARKFEATIGLSNYYCLLNNAETKKVEYYLADLETENIYFDKWTKVDVSALVKWIN